MYESNQILLVPRFQFEVFTLYFLNMYFKLRSYEIQFNKKDRNEKLSQLEPQ